MCVLNFSENLLLLEELVKRKQSMEQSHAVTSPLVRLIWKVILPAKANPKYPWLPNRNFMVSLYSRRETLCCSFISDLSCDFWPLRFSHTKSWNQAHSYVIVNLISLYILKYCRFERPGTCADCLCLYVVSISRGLWNPFAGTDMQMFHLAFACVTPATRTATFLCAQTKARNFLLTQRLEVIGICTGVWLFSMSSHCKSLLDCKQD